MESHVTARLIRHLASSGLRSHFYRSKCREPLLVASEMPQSWALRFRGPSLATVHLRANTSSSRSQTPHPPPPTSPLPAPPSHPLESANLLCSAQAHQSVTGRQKKHLCGWLRDLWLPQLPGLTWTLDLRWVRGTLLPGPLF